MEECRVLPGRSGTVMVAGQAGRDRHVLRLMMMTLMMLNIFHDVVQSNKESTAMLACPMVAAPLYYPCVTLHDDSLHFRRKSFWVDSGWHWEESPQFVLPCPCREEDGDG